jgi:hypothetical protein
MKELKVGQQRSFMMCPLHLCTLCTCDVSHGGEASGIFPVQICQIS